MYPALVGRDIDSSTTPPSPNCPITACLLCPVYQPFSLQLFSLAVHLAVLHSASLHRFFLGTSSPAHKCLLRQTKGDI